jgi:hypothetical protein
MHIGGGQEFVIGGYTPSSKNFDALLVGYYEGERLMFAAKVRNGFVPAMRDKVFQHFKKPRIKPCPFANLPESRKGRWGEGLTAADMEKCIWLKPRLVAQSSMPNGGRPIIFGILNLSRCGKTRMRAM